MEKEISRNRQTTEQVLLDAVRELVEESGFENVGVNAVATRAGVSKMLIYRYFGSLDGLIAAYIRQHDFWINFDEELPDRQYVGEFVKRMFRGQVALLRENYTLNRLYRWELTTDNAVIRELREKREAAGGCGESPDGAPPEGDRGGGDVDKHVYLLSDVAGGELRGI